MLIARLACHVEQYRIHLQRGLLVAGDYTQGTHVAKVKQQRRLLAPAGCIAKEFEAGLLVLVVLRRRKHRGKLGQKELVFQVLRSLLEPLVLFLLILLFLFLRRNYDLDVRRSIGIIPALGTVQLISHIIKNLVLRLRLDGK